MSVKPAQSREGLSPDVARQFTAGSRSGTFLAGLGTLLHTLGFALWLGGLVVLGAVVAPNIAGLLHTHPEIAGDTGLKNTILNSAIGNSFRIFNYIVYVCGALMLASDYLEAHGRDRAFQRWTKLRAAFTLVVLATVAYQGLVIFPAMDAAQAAGNMDTFDRLHGLYENLGAAQLPVLGFVAFATAVRNWRVTK